MIKRNLQKKSKLVSTLCRNHNKLSAAASCSILPWRKSRQHLQANHYGEEDGARATFCRWLHTISWSIACFPERPRAARDSAENTARTNALNRNQHRRKENADAGGRHPSQAAVVKNRLNEPPSIGPGARHEMHPFGPNLTHALLGGTYTRDCLFRVYFAVVFL
jgi:hypothetical protein